MDIINYREVDKLEEHLRNRTIQEALLREESIEWALNYDTKNLGKNFAIAYGLNVSEWEQYKSLKDFEKIDPSVSGEGNVFVFLGRLSLRFAEMFYDKILPHAKVYESTWGTGGVHYEKLIQKGTSTILKLRYRTHYGHGPVWLEGKIEGSYADNIFTSTDDQDHEVKIVNKYEDLTIARSSNSCENYYSYTVWYI